MDMSVDQVFEALPSLEDNPKKVWDLIEKNYEPNFFEPVIVKRYAHLFESKDEDEFFRHLEEIRRAALEDVHSISKQYDQQVKLLKHELGDKTIEIMTLREKFAQF